MKKALYNLLAAFLLPFLLICICIYVISNVIELICQTINNFFAKIMKLIDKHITPNL